MSNLTFSIGEVATLLGITPKTIKHYHDIGLLAKPERDTNNYRLYTMTHIIQLQQILRLKQFGLSLKQIEIIIQSENPNELAQIVLKQHANNLHDEISQLQHQFDMTLEFLQTDGQLSNPQNPNTPLASSLTTLSDAIKPRSSGISDILVEFEREAMFKLDQFGWDVNYELFWHHAGKQFMDMLTDEGLFIFWIERYLALAKMDINDLQGKAWLHELYHSPAKHMLRRALMPPKQVALPEEYQQHIIKLLSSLLYQNASSLQKYFLELLITQ
ncbi:MAG: MerR family transcriptional regulator [bacterium]|nr:MerR family transcriptional regulator [bacterium]